MSLILLRTVPRVSEVEIATVYELCLSDNIKLPVAIPKYARVVLASAVVVNVSIVAYFKAVDFCKFEATVVSLIPSADLMFVVPTSVIFALSIARTPLSRVAVTFTLDNALIRPWNVILAPIVTLL